jgi:hypothetical protein
MYSILHIQYEDNQFAHYIILFAKQLEVVVAVEPVVVEAGAGAVGRRHFYHKTHPFLKDYYHLLYMIHHRQYRQLPYQLEQLPITLYRY